MCAKTRGLQKVPAERSAGTAHPFATREARDAGALVVPIEMIDPDPLQPRRYFDESTLEELVESVKAYGVLQPLLVRKIDDRYQVIAGGRRLEAARRAGLLDVPVRLRETAQEELRPLQLVENLQRQDLLPIEEAKGLAQMQDSGLSMREIAELIGKSAMYVQRRLEIFDFPEDVIAALEKHPDKISLTNATRLAKIKSLPERSKAIQQLISPSKLAPTKPRSDRSPVTFKVKKGGHFDLQVRFRADRDNRQTVLDELERIVTELRTELAENP